MRITIIILLLLLSKFSFGQLPYTLDFEGGQGVGYSTSISECTDGSGDYFTLTDGSNVGGNYNGASGNYFAAQDIDANGCPNATGANATLTISNIDINGCSGLNLNIDMAEDNPQNKWDGSDYVHITYSIDGGAQQNLIWVESQTTGFNTAPLIDTDFDGIGDGAPITSTFQTFSSAISGTGASLTITITIQLNSGDEDIAFDNINVTGSNCTGCPGLSSEPTTNTSTLTTSNIACFSVDVNWTGGNGANALIVMSTNPITGTPTDGVHYNANSSFGAGDILNAGEYVVFNGTNNTSSVTVNGLTMNTLYYIQIFQYNGTITNCEENYLLGGLTTSFTTLNGCTSTSPQITSILYNSCNGGNEGTDEIFTFVTGSDPVNVDDISINYPTSGVPDYCNTGCGSNTNLNNPTYVNDLNTTAGCTVFAYADPIPPNSEVMVFTGNPPSTVLDYSSQCGASNLPVYVIFNNNTSTLGRFSNSSSSPRTLIVQFGNGQADTVSYIATSQSQTDGATVNFDAAGNPNYFISSNCVYPLPITLGDFYLEPSENKTEIFWSTLSETNCDYFEIQKSTDGVNFYTLGSVLGNGNSSKLINYSFIDYRENTTITYYRLKQVDFDGNHQYSYTISTFSNSAHVFYNSNQLNINIDNAKPNQTYLVNIYNLNGKIVKSFYTTGNEIINWNYKGLFIISIPELSVKEKLFSY